MCNCRVHRAYQIYVNPPSQNLLLFRITTVTHIVNTDPAEPCTAGQFYIYLNFYN